MSHATRIHILLEKNTMKLMTRSLLIGLFAVSITACAPPSDEAAEEAATAEEAKALAAAEKAEQAELAVKEAQAEAEKAKEEARAAERAANKRRARPVEEARAAPPPPQVCYECGVVASITPVKQKGSGTGMGAVAGAVLGGVIGHQFGGGRGKDAATAGGAIAGGVAGHEVEKRVRGSTAWRIGVNMENGGFQTVSVADPGGLAVGSPVRVVNGNVVMR